MRNGEAENVLTVAGKMFGITVKIFSEVVIGIIGAMAKLFYHCTEVIKP